jgi:pimeloyl-ACP methyl ester carboxylesterase
MATFVLIYGAASSGWYWHRVEPLLRAHGHDVVAPSLPCHDDAAGLDEYTEEQLAVQLQEYWQAIRQAT